MTYAPAVVVVGGGISGLACAQYLAGAGLPVWVVDKGRRPGGRAATRRFGASSFDHGAQYFTVRDSRFRVWVETRVQEGGIRRWDGRVGRLRSGRLDPGDGSSERFVGVPGMDALGGQLAAGLEVRSSTRVSSLEPWKYGWRVRCEDGEVLEADVAVLAMPAPQALPLVPEGSALEEPMVAVRFSPCWAVLVEFEGRLPLELDGAFVADSPLSWIARESSKPGRERSERWVLHGTSSWSAEHLGADGPTVTRLLLRALRDSTGATLPPIRSVEAHRWGYARAEMPLQVDCLYSSSEGLGACGDWCRGDRVEDAFLSGAAMADEILRDADRRGRRLPTVVAEPPGLLP